MQQLTPGAKMSHNFLLIKSCSLARVYLIKTGNCSPQSLSSSAYIFTRSCSMWFLWLVRAALMRRRRCNFVVCNNFVLKEVVVVNAKTQKYCKNQSRKWNAKRERKVLCQSGWNHSLIYSIPRDLKFLSNVRKADLSFFCNICPEDSKLLFYFPFDTNVHISKADLSFSAIFARKIQNYCFILNWK